MKLDRSEAIVFGRLAMQFMKHYTLLFKKERNLKETWRYHDEVLVLPIGSFFRCIIPSGINAEGKRPQ